MRCSTTVELPSNQELADTLKKALKDAENCTTTFGMNFELSDIVVCPLRKPCVLNVRTIPSDCGSDSSDEEQSIFNSIQNLNLPEYDKDKVSLSDESKFIEVCYSEGPSQIVRKSSIVWLLSESTQKLSSDRLKRVQSTPFQKSFKRIKPSIIHSGLATDSSEPVCKSESIRIGEWCIFELNYDSEQLIDSTIEYGIENVVIGAVIAFRYVQGKKPKDHQYHMDSAPIQKTNEIDRDIEALSNWYTIKNNGILNPSTLGFFIPIKNYLFTTQSPTVTQREKRVENIETIKAFLSE